MGLVASIRVYALQATNYADLGLLHYAGHVCARFPLTILVDERIDGVRLSYDLMASLVAPYGSQAALEVARDFDLRIETLLEKVAQ